MVFGDIATKFSQTVIDEIDLLLVLAGSGAADSVLDLVKQFVPLEGIAGLSDDVLATIVGYIIWSYGDRIHPRLAPFGLGVFIAGAGSIVGEWVSGFISGLGQGGG